MTEQALTLNGARLTGRASGALWWAEERLLCVADLHLGKSERIARRGGALLPPYETAETLDRLEAEIAALDPELVVCLGDSFDDMDASGALSGRDHARLGAIASGRDWLGIAGNHDPLPLTLPGAHQAELRLGPLTFRHAAETDAAPGEVSGHYHPKLRLAAKGRRLVAEGRVLKPGRRLVIVAAEIWGEAEDGARTHVATMLGTMIPV